MKTEPCNSQNKNLFIPFRGRFGNNLYQYFVGKIIEKQMDRRLFFIIGTEACGLESLSSLNNIRKFIFFKNDNTIKLNDINDLDISKMQRYTDNKSMAFLTNNTYNGKYKPFENDNNILLYSYLQNSKFLESNKEYILNEFKEDLEQNASFDYYNDDVVLVHVRLGDFFYMKRVLSFSYYESILEKLKFKKLYIVTDQPNHEYIEQFKKYNIDLSLNTGDAKEKFLKAQQFKRIVMSTSTYCWWFTFLSKATEIYIPDIENSKFFKTGINIDPYSPYYLYLNDSVRIKTKYISS